MSTDPARVLEVACRTGFEGIVAKATASPFVPGRSPSWLKIKCSNRQELAIVGWLPLLKTKPLVGSLLLGLVHADGRFHFAGKVGTGFDDRTRKSLFDLLSKDGSPTPTADEVPRCGGLVRFVVPRQVAEVAFSEWTGGGHVRHPSFQGLRKCTEGGQSALAPSSLPIRIDTRQGRELLLRGRHGELFAPRQPFDRPLQSKRVSLTDAPPGGERLARPTTFRVARTAIPPRTTSTPSAKGKKPPPSR